MKERDKKLLATVGKRVRDLRKDAGLSQTDLAFKAGIEQYHVSKIENGQNSTSITILNSIAVALKIPLAELVTFEKK